jgi:hypothetical protein
VIKREVPIHPRNNDSEIKISFQVLINITPINDGGVINDSGIIIKSVMVEPSYLKPLQKKVSKEKIDNINGVIDDDGYLPKTWVDANNNILDGHHRVYAYQSRPDIDKVECYKIFLNSKDACRILNKIQDRIDFKKEYGIRSPSTFNMMDTIQTELNNVAQPQHQAQYLGPDKEQEQEVAKEKLDFNDVTNKVLTLYSVRPFDKKNTSGFIMSFTKDKGYDKEYEILFDKILHVPTEEMELHEPFYLAGMYILDPEFEKDPTMIKKMASDVNQVYAHFIKNRLNGFAKRGGYDGINFGDKLMLIIT